MKEKEHYWQAIRGICIICVILIHCKSGFILSQDNLNFCYAIIMRNIINFPVAIFIFLSGYFLNIEKLKNDPCGYFSKRKERLIIPFILWSAFYLLIATIFHPGQFQLKNIFIQFVTGKAAGQLYFIIVLVQLTLLTPKIVTWINNKQYHVLLLSITPLYLLILYMIQYYMKKQMPLYETIFLAWFIFYYWGVYVRINGIRFLTIKMSLYIVIGTLFLSLSETVILLYCKFPEGFSISQIRVSSFLYSFSVIYLLFAVKYHFRSLTDSLFVKVGKYSYGIYFVHMFWIMITNKILTFIPVISNLFLQHLFTLIFVGTFSILSIKYTKKLLGEKTAGKYLGF